MKAQLESIDDAYFVFRLSRINRQNLGFGGIAQRDGEIVIDMPLLERIISLIGEAIDERIGVSEAHGLSINGIRNLRTGRTRDGTDFMVVEHDFYEFGNMVLPSLLFEFRRLSMRLLRKMTFRIDNRKVKRVLGEKAVSYLFSPFDPRWNYQHILEQMIDVELVKRVKLATGLTNRNLVSLMLELYGRRYNAGQLAIGKGKKRASLSANLRRDLAKLLNTLLYFPSVTVKSFRRIIKQKRMPTEFRKTVIKELDFDSDDPSTMADSISKSKEYHDTVQEMRLKHGFYPVMVMDDLRKYPILYEFFSFDYDSVDDIDDDRFEESAEE